jgi:hypothetical protein
MVALAPHGRLIRALAGSSFVAMDKLTIMATWDAVAQV